VSNTISVSASAACRVAADFGFVADDPVILQETNNTVVWLRPHPIIGKVGTRNDERPSAPTEAGSRTAGLLAPGPRGALSVQAWRRRFQTRYSQSLDALGPG
jgi:hypothetical protein